MTRSSLEFSRTSERLNKVGTSHDMKKMVEFCLLENEGTVQETLMYNVIKKGCIYVF